EWEERVERPAVAVRIAELGNVVVPAEVPGEEGPERPAVVRPAMKRVRDCAGFDAADHDPEDGGEPDRPDDTCREQGMLRDGGCDPPANGQPRRVLPHGRNALRHGSEDSAQARDPKPSNSLLQRTTRPGQTVEGPESLYPGRNRASNRLLLEVARAYAASTSTGSAPASSRPSCLSHQTASRRWSSVCALPT